MPKEVKSYFSPLSRKSKCTGEKFLWRKVQVVMREKEKKGWRRRVEEEKSQENYRGDEESIKYLKLLTCALSLFYPVL